MTGVRRIGVSWLLLVAMLMTVSLVAFPRTIQGAEETHQKVDVNSATEAELASLPGIGPSYAKRIVEYREKNGPFQRVEDLLNVRGIGDKTLEKIRDKITVKGRR